MLDIHFNDKIEPDERMQHAIAKGVYLAKRQGYDVEGLSFFVQKPSKILPLGAGAGILEGERNIALAVDANNPNYDVVSQLVVHEINHLEREKYSPIETLEEVLVSEGLAQMAEETSGFQLLEPSCFKSKENRAIAIKSMSGDFNSVVIGERAEKDYDDYFGVGGVVPDYAGYALGYEIVKCYMMAKGIDLTVATQIPAQDFTRHWTNSLIAK